MLSGNICEILVSKEVVEKLQKRLKWLNCVHTDIRKQYKNRIDAYVMKAISEAGVKCSDLVRNILIELPLSNKGLMVVENMDGSNSMKLLFCCSCWVCLKRVSKIKELGPPKFSIANNWASGELPDGIGIEDLTYAEIRMATRASISSVIKVVGRNNKELKYHTMALLATPALC